MTQTDVGFDTHVSDAAAKIRALAAGDGYTTILPDRGKNRLTVLWKAPLPKEVAALDGTELDGFGIDVRSAQYSQADLLSLSDRLLEASRAGTVPSIIGAKGNDDASGLIVEASATTLAKVSSEVLSKDLSSIVDAPVEVRVGEKPVVPTSRQNDSDPWYGGGMMEAPGFNPPDDLNPYLFCSTGFAAVTSGSFGRLLSARHCDTDDGIVCDRAWKDGHHDPLTDGGADVDCHQTNDTLLIDPIGGTDGWVHGGPWDATSSNSRYHLKVAGDASPVYLQKVCSSGANSGEHCNLQVADSTLFSWNCGPGTCHGWRAQNPNSTKVAVVGGDSGGPVYMNRDDGRVGARGIIYGGNVDGNCGDVRFAVSNCFRTVWFNDIESVLNQWNGIGLSVETTP
jgi:hypothetical protein